MANRHTLLEQFKVEKPSVVVSAFIEWLQVMKDEQEDADATFKLEDGERVKDFLHALEFEDDAKKRALIATQVHKSRKARRVAKDKARLLRPIKFFVTDTSNKYFFKRLKTLRDDLRTEEEYQGSERTYKPRAQEKTEGTVEQTEGEHADV